MIEHLSHAKLPVTFPLNREGSSELILEDKADALIACHSDRLPELLAGCGDFNSGILTLPQDYAFRFDAGPRKFLCCGRNALIGSDGLILPHPGTFCVWDDGRWQNCSFDLSLKNMFKCWSTGHFGEELRKQYGSYGELILKLRSHFSDLGKIVRYFGQSSKAFEPWKPLATAAAAPMMYVADTVPEALQQLRKDNPSASEAACVNALLRSLLLSHNRNWQLCEEYFKIFDGDFPLMYRFCNSDGDVVMAVADIWHFGLEHPRLQVPLISWKKDGRGSFLTSTPGISPMPLWGAEKLADGRIKNVIVTDSLGFAALNANLIPEDTGLVSFLKCADFRQHDWSPLKQSGLHITLLVSNLYGEDLTEGYESTEQLRTHLESEKISVSDFIQMPVNVPRQQRRIASLDDLLRAHRDAPPVIDVPNIRQLSPDDFAAELEKVHRFATIPELRWWFASPAVQKTESAEPETVSEQKRFLVYPILPVGGNVMIHAPKGVGKSMVSQVLCGALTACRTSPSAFLDPFWFVVNKPSHQHDIFKVLYLDFENGPEIAGRLKLLEKSFWKTDAERSKSNLIIRDLKLASSVNYTLPGERQKLLDMLKDAENRGVAGQVPDLLVIDTYTKFIGGTESSATTRDLNDTLKLLRHNYPNLTVLILTHSAEDGSVKGYKEKIEDMNVVIELSRINDARGPLTEVPIRLRIKEYRGALPAFAYEPAEIKLENGHFTLAQDEQQISQLRVDNLREFNKFYAELDVEERASYLGRRKSSYYDLIAKAK